MTLDSPIETVTFDSYSTLVDVDAAERVLDERVADPASVAALWRRRSLEYAMVSGYLDAYRPFYEMNRAALGYALAAHDAGLGADERDAILEVYHDLDPFPEVRDAIERIDAAGYDCYVVSNGDPAMLDSMIETVGVGGALRDAISADEVEAFKPDARLYEHAAARTGTPVDRIAHAAAGWADVLGAMHAGMAGVWVDRDGRPWEAFGDDPDLTVADLDELADALDA